LSYEGTGARHLPAFPSYRAHPYIRLNYLASRHSARRCIPACARRILIKARGFNRAARAIRRGGGGGYVAEARKSEWESWRIEFKG